MLDGLDRVDWASLEHAYGEASDVPDMLRSLTSTRAKVRSRALEELFGTIWHQGTVYPASAAALPFLYELLAAPDVPDRSSIAYLIASIADGNGYLEVHAGDNPAESIDREILEERGLRLEDELERESAEIDAVRRAASANLRHLLPYLRDNESEVRQSVAAAFSNYPEHADWILPAIETALATETNEGVREALTESRDRLMGRRG